MHKTTGEINLYKENIVRYKNIYIILQRVATYIFITLYVKVYYAVTLCVCISFS